MRDKAGFNNYIYDYDSWIPIFAYINLIDYKYEDL